MMAVAPFTYPGWTLAAALDAIFAYHGGSDSGVSDSDLKAAVVAYLNGLSDDDRRLTLAVYARLYLADDSIMAGYGIADVVSFAGWLEEVGVGVG